MALNDAGARQELRSLTAEVVSSYLANNSVHSSDVPAVIASVHSALSALGKPSEPVVEKPVPPVSIKKSVTAEYLISMEDGRQYKSLKRHLKGRGLTPEQYREKWGLPRHYPMTAPAYSARRSELARTIGLGRKRQAAPAPAPAKRGGLRKGA